MARGDEEAGWHPSVSLQGPGYIQSEIGRQRQVQVLSRRLCGTLRYRKAWRWRPSSVPRSLCSDGSTGRNLDRAHLVAEPVCDNGFGDAVDNFVVIKARISEPVSRLIDGDCRAVSATVSDEDKNHVQGVVHLGDTNKVERGCCVNRSPRGA
jgi:hypothetical protein